MARKPGKISISSLAGELGVSVATISRVMNNRIGVNEEKRRKVLAYLRENNFRINYPRQRGAKIAVVTEHANLSSYVSLILQGSYGYSRTTDLQINVLIYEKHLREPLLSILRDQQYSGVILPSPIWVCSQIEELAASKLPVMLIDQTMDVGAIGCIDHDSRLASRIAVNYLWSLGHRQIGCLGSRHISQQRERFLGYLDTMRAHGIQVKPTWCRLRNDFNDYYKFGYTRLESLLRQAPELTAVVALDDDTAIGMICRAGELGIRVPEELSIVGFKDILAARYTNPPLTTVGYPIGKAGEIAIRAIHESLESNGGKPLPRLLLPCTLIPRGTTAPPRCP